MAQERLKQLIREIINEELYQIRSSVNNIKNQHQQLEVKVKSSNKINDDNLKIKSRLKYASGFIAAIVFIFGIDIFTFNYLLRGALEKRIYPPSYILEQSSGNISINELKEKSTTLKDEAPDFVWDSIDQWEPTQYSDFINKKEVIETLTKNFEKQLHATIDVFSQKDKFTPDDIKSIGRLPMPATITMIGESSLNTSCYVSVDNNKKQAIVVLPPDIDESFFIAYGCDHKKYPKNIFIRLIDGNGDYPMISDVKIIGIEQGNIYEGQLEIRLTKAAAMAMELEGAKEYKSKLNNVEVSIANASNE